MKQSWRAINLNLVGINKGAFNAYNSETGGGI